MTHHSSADVIGHGQLMSQHLVSSVGTDGRVVMWKVTLTAGFQEDEGPPLQRDLGLGLNDHDVQR